MAKTTTGERLAKLETKVEYIVEIVDDMKDMLKEHVEREDVRFDSLDKKYAAKPVERIVYGLVGIILTATVVTIYNLILI